MQMIKPKNSRVKLLMNELAQQLPSKHALATYEPLSATNYAARRYPHLRK